MEVGYINLAPVSRKMSVEKHVENVEIKLQTNCHNHIVSLANPNEKTYKENVEIKLQAKCLNASSPSHAISISMELIHLNERMFDD